MSTFWNSAGAQVNRAKLAQQVVPTIAANMVSDLVQCSGVRFAYVYMCVCIHTHACMC